ncbi:MAG TPA: hypothetical protein VMN36_12640 [Verrucomicrobiales bacterium]|nr:hypothetical protein [Verrucomicrobiales bacterium]
MSPSPSGRHSTGPLRGTLTGKCAIVTFHGGVYRTFWALLDLEEPERVLEAHDETPLLESRPELIERLNDLHYMTV